MNKETGEMVTLMAEEFRAAEAEDENISGSLYRAIKGRGAFRKFKEKIHDLRVADKWYEYRDSAIRHKKDSYRLV